MNVPGSILDSSCGSGHMLERIAAIYSPGRHLVGIDLSTEMVRVSTGRLGDSAKVFKGDMASLSKIADTSCAAVISFFAIHHVDLPGFRTCLDEWGRVLASGGHLFLAAWEGTGNVDYGDVCDIDARRYTKSEIAEAASLSRFRVIRHSVEPVDEMDMDSVHLVAKKP